jgi:hypothetical protein
MQIFTLKNKLILTNNCECDYIDYFCLMKFLKFIFSAYINSSIHVAFAVCSLAGITCLEFDVKLSLNLLGFIFFGTVSGYNFVKYASVYRKRFKELFIYLKVIQIASVISLLYFAFQLSWIILIVFGGFATLTFLYTIPLLKRKNLRNFTRLKITIVAFVWAGVTVLAPILNEGISLDLDIWLTFFQRFFIVFTLTLPFEIRDLQYDEITLETLPQRVGIKKTKVIGILMLFFVMLLELFKDFIQLNHLFSLEISLIVLLVFLLNSNKNQSNYLSSFWVEGIPIIWFGIFGLLQYYFDISW